MNACMSVFKAFLIEKLLTSTYIFKSKTHFDVIKYIDKTPN